MSVPSQSHFIMYGQSLINALKETIWIHFHWASSVYWLSSCYEWFVFLQQEKELKCFPCLRLNMWLKSQRWELASLGKKPSKKYTWLLGKEKILFLAIIFLIKCQGNVIFVISWSWYSLSVYRLSTDLEKFQSSGSFLY